MVNVSVDVDLETASSDFARSLVAEGRPALPTRARSSPAITQEAFNAALARLKRKTRGQDAPAACVASVKRAMTLPFDEAVARDRDAFATLSAGRQSRALRHIFFAERQAARLAAGTARQTGRASSRARVCQ